jgi:hypothetical protein
MNHQIPHPWISRRRPETTNEGFPLTMYRFTILAVLIPLLCQSNLLPAASPRRVTARPEDTGEALENPWMGWVFHHFDNSIIYKKGVTFHSDWMARGFWPARPIVLESGHYWSNDVVGRGRSGLL